MRRNIFTERSPAVNYSSPLPLSPSIFDILQGSKRSKPLCPTMGTVLENVLLYYKNGHKCNNVMEILRSMGGVRERFYCIT